MASRSSRRIRFSPSGEQPRTAAISALVECEGVVAADSVNSGEDPDGSTAVADTGSDEFHPVTRWLNHGDTRLFGYLLTNGLEDVGSASRLELVRPAAGQEFVKNDS